MIKGLILTPPTLGRISIGRVVTKNGKRLPEKDDQFTITSQVQSKDGWIKHPLDNKLRQASDKDKLRQIPVRMVFNDPELNLRAEYTLFDRQTGRPVCVGNGETCQRRTSKGIEEHPCPSPDACPLAKEGGCKPYGRLYVNLSADDELGTFVFRTTGYNSIRTLASRLNYYNAVSKGKLSCLPLQLTIRGKSTTQSYRTPIYYVDLVLQDGVDLKQAIEQAGQIEQSLIEAGFDQAKLEAVARAGYANSHFVDEEEGATLLEEFYASDRNSDDNPKTNDSTTTGNNDSQIVDFGSLEQGLRQSVQAVI